MDRPESIRPPFVHGSNSKTVTVTLTPAQMLALFTTAVDLIPAPGEGKAIVVDAVYSTMDYNSAAYAVGAAETMNILYSGSTVVAALTETYLESTADARLYVKPAVTAMVPVANTKLVAKMSATNPTAGNSPVKIQVFYKIVDILL